MSESVKILMDTMSRIGSAAAAKNEEIGFDEAFMLHHRTVFRVARSVVRDEGLAENVTQEVFLRLFNNLESIENEEMLRPWLIRVALNLGRNTIRGNTRANLREENYVRGQGDRNIASVEDDYEQREQVKEIGRALDKIREPMRSCLILKQQGLSYREISQSLELNESSIGTYIARARKEFSRVFGKVGSKQL